MEFVLLHSIGNKISVFYLFQNGQFHFTKQYMVKMTLEVAFIENDHSGTILFTVKEILLVIKVLDL